MAWTTSGNLREFFGPRDLSASPLSSGLESSAAQLGRHLRRLSVLALAIAHLALLGELSTTSTAIDQKLSGAAPANGLSWPWLTITGLMLAILWLARDWPGTRGAARPASAAAAPENVGRPAATGQPCRTISTQRTSVPMTGLLARVSHDLRTPLNAVMGFSDLMQREAFGPLGDARYQTYARHIHVSSMELLKAAEDTLAMTSLVASPRASETADLQDLVAEAFTTALIGGSKADADYAAARPAGLVTLALAIAPQLQVKCERRALRQALINLMTAAIGKITACHGARTVHAAALTNNDVISLTISVILDPVPGSNTGPVASSWNSAEELPICLARALLELQGLTLSLAATDSLWNAQVMLDGVSQSDFFSS
jgi:signal transduction histidine kinase